MFGSEAIERIESASALLVGPREAPETVRAARNALAERKVRGGEGARKGRGRGTDGRGGHGRKGSGRGGRGNPAIAERKAKSVCKACGQRGHWAGDPERGTNSALLAERDSDPQGLPMQSSPPAEVSAVSVDIPLPISV